jgi:hypothetical protein
MATLFNDPHAHLRMQARGVSDDDVHDAVWTNRARHERHATRPGSFYAPVPGRKNLWVLYRPLNGDDFVITVTPRPGAERR